MIFKTVFHSPKSTLANATAHIGRLQSKIHQFFQSKPWSYVIERNVERRQQLHKVKFTEALSEDLPNMIFDATTNLRAVLDQIGFAAAVALHGGAPKNAYFPIADDEIGLENVIKRKRCKDLPPQILTLFRTFKPYRDGNSIIWALNRLANNKKHASLAPVSLGGFGITGGELKIKFVEGGDGPEIGFWWDAEKNEVTFIRAGLNTEIEYNTNFFFEVTFDPALDIVGGYQPVRVLSAMADEVERVLSATETQCRQLGLIS